MLYDLPKRGVNNNFIWDFLYSSNYNQQKQNKKDLYCDLAHLRTDASAVESPVKPEITVSGETAIPSNFD